MAFSLRSGSFVNVLKKIEILSILIGYNNVIKISDFGACKDIGEKSAVMSFKGTIAWMAPEVIRNEACSEKVDIYSFGVVLWELLTCEMPYKNFDQNSIMWGVGSNKLQLTIPQSAPEGIKLLLQQCWSLKPRNRPTFSQILKHLEIVNSTEILLKVEDAYFKSQASWKEEIREKMNFTEMHQYNIEEDLIQKRKEELKHATDIRELYEQKLEKANNLYFELSTVLLQLDQREHELIKRERALNIKNERVVRPILRRESSNRASKSYSKRSISQKQTQQQEAEHEVNAIAHSVEETTRRLSGSNEFNDDASIVCNQLTVSMHDLKACEYEERAIDVGQMEKEAEQQQQQDLDMDSPEKIMQDVIAQSRVILKRLVRSKSINSFDSYSKSDGGGLVREDSLPPSYPSVLANRARSGYYSETNLYFDPDEPVQAIQTVKQENNAGKESKMLYTQLLVF